LSCRDWRANLAEIAFAERRKTSQSPFGQIHRQLQVGERLLPLDRHLAEVVARGIPPGLSFIANLRLRAAEGQLRGRIESLRAAVLSLRAGWSDDTLPGSHYRVMRWMQRMDWSAAVQIHSRRRLRGARESETKAIVERSSPKARAVVVLENGPTSIWRHCHELPKQACNPHQHCEPKDRLKS
jgi:hypothetical protein